MLIQTLCGQTFRVRETGDPDLAHAWLGTRVKRVKHGYAPVESGPFAKREILVRKQGCTILKGDRA